MFKEFDLDGTGRIDMDEFSKMLVTLNIAPLKNPEKKSSARDPAADA
jgi:Ca2+-binding EF-hand superfamily protein